MSVRVLRMKFFEASFGSFQTPYGTQMFLT